jgi:hypothetical protein
MLAQRDRPGAQDLAEAEGHRGAAAGVGDVECYVPITDNDLAIDNTDMSPEEVATQIA